MSITRLTAQFSPVSKVAYSRRGGEEQWMFGSGVFGFLMEGSDNPFNNSHVEVSGKNGKLVRDYTYETERGESFTFPVFSFNDLGDVLITCPVDQLNEIGTNSLTAQFAPSSRVSSRKRADMTEDVKQKLVEFGYDKDDINAIMRDYGDKIDQLAADGYDVVDIAETLADSYN